jgi:hypothetical protein
MTAEISLKRAQKWSKSVASIAWAPTANQRCSHTDGRGSTHRQSPDRSHRLIIATLDEDFLAWQPPLIDQADGAVDVFDRGHHALPHIVRRGR